MLYLRAFMASFRDRVTTSSTEATIDEFEPPLLNDVQQEVVDALRENGIAVVRLQDLFGEALRGEAAADIAPFALEAGKALPRTGDVPASKHDIILRRFGVISKKTAPAQLSLAGPWLQIAASELALNIVNTYRGQWTRLYYVDNWFTVPYPSVSERSLSQRWHRDPEDEHVVKVFVYFSDVDEEAGPFEYIRDSTTGSRYGELWSWGLSERYPPLDELEALIDQADHLTLTGLPGR